MQKNTAQAARRPVQRKKKRRKGLSGGQLALAIVLLVVLMGGSFGLGWFCGVKSTEFHGDILIVNTENRLDADYVPDDLVNLYKMRHSFRLASSEILLTRECYEAMEKMFAAAEDADMNGYIVTSGYRDYNRQAEIFAESEAGYAQEPGASEHQTGLAFDVTVETSEGFENTPQYSWLMSNAHKYGFIQRYPANKSSITGISYEPWHYRYVGVDAAKKMKKSGMCLEEFLAANEK
ncbi:MAG: M15 family metallopeptidase [Clostridia bacterium]|nr:M15 family metallopeptidase [Clostridia bacterium]